MISSLVFGIVELILSFIIGIFSIWLAYESFMKMTKNINDIEELKNQNAAVGISLSGFVIGVGIIMYKSIYPVLATLNTYFIQSRPELQKILSWCGYSLLFFFLSILAAITTLKLGIFIFCKLTVDIDEFKEIKQGNVALAIVFASIVIIFSFFIANGILSLLSGIIPNPSLGVLKSL